jgi:hypothetical protein
MSTEQRSKDKNLMLDDLRSCMSDLFRTRQSNKVTKPNEEEQEVSLLARASNVQNICGYCNKKGHQEEECRKKKQDIADGNSKQVKNIRASRHCGGMHWTANVGTS